MVGGGKPLFGEGLSRDGFIIVLSGKISMSITDAKGRHHEVCTLTVASTTNNLVPTDNSKKTTMCWSSLYRIEENTPILLGSSSAHISKSLVDWLDYHCKIVQRYTIQGNLCLG